MNRTLPDTVLALGVASLYCLSVTCMTDPQEKEPELGCDEENGGIVVRFPDRCKRPFCTPNPPYPSVTTQPLIQRIFRAICRRRGHIGGK